MTNNIIYPEIVSLDFNPRWIENLSSDLYHADKTAISSSSLRRMEPSPYSFHYFWKKDQTEVKDKLKIPKHFRLGHALHAALLEPKLFQSLYVVEPEFTGLTKAGLPSKHCAESRLLRDQWRESLHPDAIVLNEEELNTLNEMINSVLAHQGACTILKGGVPEISGYFRDGVTGVKCRIRPDFLNFELNSLIDVKSTKSCYRNEFSKSIYNYGYHTQLGMYRAGIEQINGKLPQHCVFISVQNSEPYEVCVYEADATVIDKGDKTYRTLIEKLATCLVDKDWPRIQKDIEYIAMPHWALTDEEEMI